MKADVDDSLLIDDACVQAPEVGDCFADQELGSSRGASSDP